MTKEDHPFITLLCSRCGHKVRIRLNCGQRSCEICRRKAWGRNARILREIFKKFDNLRVFELTIKNIPQGQFTKETVRQLRRAFSKLIHRKYYREHIKGGVYFVHITNRGRGWHIHLHIVYDGDYIPQSKLSRDWKDITGSYVVWIRPVRSVAGAVNYLISDLLQKPKIRPEDVDRFNAVMKGQKIIQGFGTLSKLKLKREFICPNCGNNCWIIQEFINWDKIYLDSS